MKNNLEILPTFYQSDTSLTKEQKAILEIAQFIAPETFEVEEVQYTEQCRRFKCYSPEGMALVHIRRSILSQENPVKHYLQEKYLNRVSYGEKAIDKLEKELEEAKSRVAFFLGKLKELEE